MTWQKSYANIKKTLPNVEPFDVDDEFAQVYKETEDGNLSIRTKCSVALDFVKFI